MNVGLNLFDDRPDGLRAKSAWMTAGLVVANAAAWAWAWAVFADRPALMGTAFLAWVFGLRHAFDADHIAAIDNTVRKLMQDGKAPASAGFFFSLGHSSVVVLASAAIAAATASMQDRLEQWHTFGGVFGTGVSAFFLLAIGCANLFVLRDVWSAFVRARRGDRIDLDLALAGGWLGRLFRPLFRMVRRSWYLYPIGFLFGLGFDTATEIGLLGISAGQAAQGMGVWTILVFPALFTAGMSLLDTLDSVLMTHAYGWAFVNPVRKLWYNLTITAASVVVAVFIGGIEALGLIGDRLGLDGGFWETVGLLNDNLTQFGFVVAGLFIASWMVSSMVYRVTGYSQARVK
jgi:high-affinity nickel-transport protein